MEYVIIAIALIIVFGILYRRKQKAHFIVFENLVIDSLPEIFAENKDRDETECLLVAEIINGHYDHQITNRMKNKSIKRFREWLKREHFLFNIITEQQLELRNKYIRDKLRLDDFRCQYIQVSPCLTSGKHPVGWQLLCKDGFTEVFPTSPDMDDWAVDSQLRNFFALNEISLEESVNFVFHEKRHYINHKMKQAIIQFDLYKRPA